MTCKITGCGRQILARSMCSKHYCKWQKYGDPTAGREYSSARGDGCLRPDGYVTVCRNSVPQLEHILVAEKALGRPLPSGTKVHHVDEDRSNNANQNLVICPSEAYHKMLHVRMRAMAACGNPNWRICTFCKKYDDPSAMYVKQNQAWHRECRNEHDYPTIHPIGVSP